MDRFTNSMIQYPFTTPSNQRTKYSNDIRQVIKQACKQLYILLQNITATYKKLGIAHNPTQFYQAIFRIITPLQLLNQHQITTQFLYTPQERLVRPQKITAFTPNFKPEQKQIFKQQQKTLRMGDVEHQFDGEKNGWESNQAESHFNEDTSNKRKRRNQNGSQKSRGGFGVTNKIDHEMEKAVYEWAMQCFKNWKRLQMVDICRYAKQVSKNAIFLASSGWCANFLNRHPDLKTLVKSRHQIPKQQSRRTPQQQQQESRQLLQTGQNESQIKERQNRKAERGNPIHPNPLYSRDLAAREQPQTTRNPAIKYPENNKRNYMDGINSDNEQDYLNYGDGDGDEDEGYGVSELRNEKDELSEQYGYQGNGGKSVKMEGIVDNQGYNYYENKM